mmetsp:Transcript_56802/g.164808  ORF Transcript_56802/g.164808 Transcript_56802/m.164808 type:complete len:362 (+) Transcript_56802:1443-2528(+)
MILMWRMLFKVTVVSCNWIRFTSSSRISCDTMLLNCWWSSDQSPAEGLETSTVALLGSSKRTARSPKQVPLPNVRISLSSIETLTSPSAMTKNERPISPCWKTLAPWLYFLSTSTLTSLLIWSSDKSRKTGTFFANNTFLTYSITDSSELPDPKPARPKSCSALAMACFLRKATVHPPLPDLRPVTLSCSCLSLWFFFPSPSICCRASSWQNSPRCKVTSFEPFLPVTEPSTTINKRESSSTARPGPKVLTTMASESFPCCGADKWEKTGMLFKTERNKLLWRHCARSSPNASFNCGMPMQMTSAGVSATTVELLASPYKAARSPKQSPLTKVAFFVPPSSLPLAFQVQPSMTESSPFLTQ